MNTKADDRLDALWVWDSRARAYATVKTPVVGELLLGVSLSISEHLHQMQGDPASIPSGVVDLYSRPVTETQGGHFLQEEVPIEFAAALMRIVDQVQASNR